MPLMLWTSWDCASAIAAWKALCQPCVLINATKSSTIACMRNSCEAQQAQGGHPPCALGHAEVCIPDSALRVRGGELGVVIAVRFELLLARLAAEVVLLLLVRRL